LKSVFISHSSKDEELVGKFVTLLKAGIGVPGDEIFCSSIDPHGVPTGETLNSYLKSKLEENKLVIQILTPNYHKSAYCMCELGGTWILDKNWFPLLVPPLTYNELEGVLRGTVPANITDISKLNELRDRLDGLITLEDRDNTSWENQRGSFIKFATSYNNTSDRISKQ
jgi:hypothetical protein